MNNSNNTSYQAGKAVGQTQEKGSQLLDKAGGAAQSAKGSVMGAGKVVQNKTQEAVNYVKGAVAKK